jgi:hypothetical protein
MHGLSGEVLYVYQCAARLGRWSLVADQTAIGAPSFVVTAPVTTLHTYYATQDGLILRLHCQRGVYWVWNDIVLPKRVQEQEDLTLSLRVFGRPVIERETLLRAVPAPQASRVI